MNRVIKIAKQLFFLTAKVPFAYIQGLHFSRSNNQNPKLANIFLKIYLDGTAINKVYVTKKIARNYFIAKKYKPARKYFEKALSISDKPLDYESLLLYIRSLIRSGDHACAEKVARAAVEGEQSQSGEVYYLLGVSLLFQKKWWQAEDAYLSAIENGCRLPRCYQHLGLAAYKMSHFKRSYEAYLSSAKAWKMGYQNRKATMFYRAGLSAERANLITASKNCYEKALSYDREFESKELGIGIFHEKQGFLDLATDAYVTLAKKKDIPTITRSHAFYRAGIIKHRENDLGQAIALYSNSVKYDRVNPWKHYRLAKALKEAGRLQEALLSCEEAILRKSDYVASWHTEVIHIYSLLGKHREVKRHLNEQKMLLFREDKVDEVNLKRSYINFYEELELDEKTILYESFHGHSISENPLAIFLEVSNNPKYKGYRHIFVVNKFENIPKWMRASSNVFYVKRSSYLYYKHLATAKWLINNTTFPPDFIRKKGQKYLNTWHGVTWKTLGKDIKGAFSENSNAQRNFLQSTHIISPNRYMTDTLIEAYDLKGLLSAKIAETGYPRTDITINQTSSNKKALKKQLGISNDKKTILYAPTWKGTLNQVSDETEDVKKTLNVLKALNCNVLFRGHILHTKGIDEETLKTINVDDKISSNDLLGVVDVLVTDYSSIGFDFLALKKPVVYLLNDYDSYSQQRGLYFNHKELPGSKAFSINALGGLVERALSQKHRLNKPYKAALQKFCPLEDGLSSKRTVEFFFENSKTCEVKVSNDKQTVLIYPAGLDTNGITSSLISLINTLPLDNYRVALAIDPVSIADKPERMRNYKMLSSKTNVLMRCRGMLLLENESISNKEYREPSRGISLNQYSDTLRTAYTREFRRLYGETFFSHVVDFSGYSRYWTGVLGAGCMGVSPSTSRSVFLHADMDAERSARFPYLQSSFWMYKFYDRLISVSSEINKINKNSISKYNPIPEYKFDYVDNSVDFNRIKQLSIESIEKKAELDIINSEGLKFIFVGRLSVEKGLMKLLNSFERVCKEFPSAKLLIVGDGPLKASIAHTINNKQLADNVYLLGRKPNPYKYIKNSDCLVLSSDHEGQGLVLLEALTLKKPFVATRLPAYSSALARYGIMVDNSIEGFEDGLKEYLKERPVYPEFNISGYQNRAMKMFQNKVLVDK